MPSKAPTNQLELVTFARPPVEEIAFAIQLADAQLGLDEMVDVGRALGAQFPVKQLQPTLPRMTDADGPQFSISASVHPQLPRLWFVSEDGLRVVQIQEDRVAFNWRRLGRDTRYPRYAKLREEFQARLSDMAGAAAVLGDERLRADFCELTYVNQLTDPSSRDLPPLDAVLRVAQPLQDADFLPPPDDAQWLGRWTVRDRNEEPAGRLSVGVQPAVRNFDQRPMYLMTMTAAIPGQTAGWEAAFARLDLGHEWIVRGFADLTTKRMHEEWGRSR